MGEKIKKINPSYFPSAVSSRLDCNFGKINGTSFIREHFLWLSWAASIDLPWNLWSPSAPSPGSCTFKGINLTPHKYYVLFLHFAAQNWFILEQSFGAECSITHLQLAFSLWIMPSISSPRDEASKKITTHLFAAHTSTTLLEICPQTFSIKKKVDFSNSLPFFFSHLVLFSSATLTLTQE